MPLSEGNILNEGGNQYPLDKMIGRSRRNVVPMEVAGGDRIPPHSNDAEMAVLGAMMLDKNAANEAIRLLGSDAFYREGHRQIYQAMIALSERNQPIDIITVNEELRRNGKLADIGGSHYLAEINRRTPTTANVEHHARIVFEKALKRRMIHAAMGILGSCYSDTTDAFEELDKAEQTIFEISESRNRSSASSIERLAKETIAFIEEMTTRQAEGGAVGTPTGLTRFDSETGGFQKANLIILAARPSMGKTSLAMSIMRNAAVDYKKPIAFFSLEMSSRELMIRLIAAESKVNAQRIQKGDLKQEHWQQIVATIHRLAGAPIYIDDSPALSIMDLRARARLLKREHGIEMLVVDYLQLMHAPKAESREREISVISRGLKQLSKELGIPVIALSQLNRSVEARTDKRPMLSDLRESGSIEQDADMVMFVHRPEYYGITVDEENRPTEGVAELIVGKNRSGPVFNVRLAFIREFTRFENLDEFHSEADEYLPPASDEDPF